MVTDGNVNTFLFIINALKGRDIHICATSTSSCWESEIRALGVKEFVLIDPALESFSRNQKLNDIIAKAGPFEYVCDPFFDIHLGKVVELMAPGARYITCGLFDQYLSFIGEESHYSGLDLRRILGWVLVNNLQIIGNCLGQTKDLSAAIQDYASGSFNVVVDSVFQGGNVADFLNQTYNAKDRFGKVVYRYD